MVGLSYFHGAISNFYPLRRKLPPIRAAIVTGAAFATAAVAAGLLSAYNHRKPIMPLPPDLCARPGPMNRAAFSSSCARLRWRSRQRPRGAAGAQALEFADIAQPSGPSGAARNRQYAARLMGTTDLILARVRIATETGP